MSKITIEAAEKLTPEDLTELIIQNVPPGEIRACLANLEKVNIPDEPEPVIQPSIPNEPEPINEPIFKPSVQNEPTPITQPSMPDNSNTSSIDYWRSRCSKNPILIISTDTVLPGKDGTYVIYYVKSKDGKFVKKSLNTSKFNTQTCADLGEDYNNDCEIFFEWVSNTVIKLPKEKENLKRVIEEYKNKNLGMFIDFCKNNPKYDDLLISLGIKEGQEKPQLLDIVPVNIPKPNNLGALVESSKKLVPKTGILVFPQFTKDGKIRIYGPFMSNGVIVWEKKDITLNYLNTKVSALTIAAPGSDRYKKYEEAFERVDRNSAVYRNIRTVLIGLRRIGISPPYPFLNDLQFGKSNNTNIILKNL